MYVYFFVFFLISINALFENRAEYLNRRLLYIFTFIIFIFTAGFRNEVGGDWDSYLLNFIGYTNINFYDAYYQIRNNLFNIDPAFYLLNIVINKLGLSIHFVNFSASIIFCLGLFKFISILNRPLLGLLNAYPFYFVIVSMGFTKQSIALGIIFYSIERFSFNKYNQTFLLIFLSCLFHKSAFIFYFIFFVIYIITNNKGLIFNFFIGCFFLFFNLIIFYFFSDIILGKFDNYLIENYDASGIYLRLIYLFIGILITFVCIFKADDLKYSFKVFLIISICFALILVSLLFFFDGSTFVDRMLIYFMFFNIYGLSSMPIILNKFIPSVLTTILIIIFNFFYLYIWFIFANHSDSWLPYSNYFWRFFNS